MTRSRFVLSRLRAAALAALVVSVSTACRGKLPTAGECETLALRSLGIKSSGELEDPRVLRALQTLTTECITTPYDREFLKCVEVSRDLPACALAFKTRSHRSSSAR